MAANAAIPPTCTVFSGGNLNSPSSVWYVGATLSARERTSTQHTEIGQ